MIVKCALCVLNILTRYFAILYVVAFILLITGRIGMLGLCNFSCAFSVEVKVSFGLGTLFFVYL